MKRSGKWVLTAAAVVTMAWATTPSFAATAPQRAVVHGEKLAKLAQAKPMGALDPQQSIHFSVALNPRDEAAMKAFVASLYQPTSVNYHHFLQPGQFTAKFGPTAAQYQSVIDFLEGQGFTVTKTYSNRLLVDAVGTVGQLEQAFQIQMNHYQLDGRDFFATANDVSVPAAIAPMIAGVIGLDNLAQMHPQFASQAPADTHSPTTPRAATATSGYTPQQIHTAYNFAPLYQAGVNGSGETIAIATAYTYSPSDVSAFDSAFGLSAPNVQNVSVDGSTSQTNVETTLDLEWSHATAPNAKVMMYEGANSSLSTFTDVYNRIASDDLAQAVSTSWGTSEDNMSTATLNADDNIFAQMASQGQSVFAAAGDNGATDGSYFYLETDYPSIDPYVTACGGTTLTLNSDNTYNSEQGWSGSGGGESDYFGEPSWQTGTNVPQDGYRQSPDIALNADPNTGYSYYFNGSWGVAGGTSFVAPQMAGTFALVDQDRASHGLGVIGQADPAIYSLASNAYGDFHDATSGNNGYYNCGPGYDNVTGWGSIDANAFVGGLS